MKNLFIKKLLISSSENTFLQLFRYGIVGGVAFMADFGSLWSLTEYLHLHYLLSAAIAFVIGLIVNYILSTLWVFKENKYDNRWVEFVLFSIIGLIGLGMNEAIIYLFADVLSLHYIIGKIASTIIVFFWNFFGRKYLLFKK